jgi:hypothetical protein
VTWQPCFAILPATFWPGTRPPWTAPQNQQPHAWHKTGQAGSVPSGAARIPAHIAKEGRDAAGFVSTGPAQDFRQRSYMALYRLACWWDGRRTAAANDRIAVVDIGRRKRMPRGSKEKPPFEVVANVEIFGRDFPQPGEQTFRVTVESDLGYPGFEARVWWAGHDNLAHLSTLIHTFVG